MAQPFKPVALLALARLDRRILLGAYLAFVVLMASALVMHLPALWAAVFVVCASLGWLVIRCVLEMVMTIIEVLLPQ
jgi:hypothetical protein